MTSTALTRIGDLDGPLDVLVFARSCQQAADFAQKELFVAAVTWAEQHPPESIDQAATWMSPAGDTGLLLAGEGAPLVAEFCIAEFALAIGRSTDSGRAFIAHAVEVKYRLPRTWTRIMRGDLQVWRARRIAELTIGLSPRAVAFVDQQVAPFAHRIGVAAMERLVEEAITRFMPDLAAERADKAAEGRHFNVHDEQVSFEGTVRVHGELDLADALDLDEAICQEAEALRAAGSTQSLDVLRSQALGQISRNQLAFDLSIDTHTHTDTDTGKGSSTRPRSKPRQVVLYVHLSHAAVHGIDGDLHLARVENTRSFVSVEQVKSWCANPDAQVVVKPVIDLEHRIHVEAYEAPERLDEQTALINHTCVFPWCTRPARKTDSEHVVPYARGGTTSSDNQAPVCRRHHRLKTHSTWTYTMLEAGTYLWTSPHGYQFLRDHRGTLDVSSDRRAPAADSADPPDR